MTSLPDLGPSQYPSMEDITESCKGVVKLLKYLKPHKADDILLMLINETAEEITPGNYSAFSCFFRSGEHSFYIA